MKYGAVGSLERTLFHVQGGATNDTTISNLLPNTLYSVEVAPVNSFSIIHFLQSGIEQLTLQGIDHQLLTHSHVVKRNPS